MMRTFVALILLLALSPARADSEARIGADWVRVTALPCSAPAVLALLQAAGEDPADYRAASADWGGKTFSACWRPDFQRRMVLMRYDDGDRGEVPFDALKPIKEA